MKFKDDTGKIILVREHKNREPGNKVDAEWIKNSLNEAHKQVNAILQDNPSVQVDVFLQVPSATKRSPDSIVNEFNKVVLRKVSDFEKWQECRQKYSRFRVTIAHPSGYLYLEQAEICP